jgi:hypothetical protein
MPREVAPPNHREFRDWWERTLASDQMHLTPEAKETGYSTAFEIPMPSSRAPAKAVHDLIMLGSLRGAGAGDLRDGLPPPPEGRLPGGGPGAPQRPSAHPAEGPPGLQHRPLPMVARTERRRLERGERTPQVA